MLFLCFTCRSDGAKVLYITFFYKHFTPTGLFFQKTNRTALVLFDLEDIDRLPASLKRDTGQCDRMDRRIAKKILDDVRNGNYNICNNLAL
jgi:hypothetical protein